MVGSGLLAVMCPVAVGGAERHALVLQATWRALFQCSEGTILYAASNASELDALQAE